MPKHGENVWTFLYSELSQRTIESLSYVSPRRCTTGHVSSAAKFVSSYLGVNFQTDIGLGLADHQLIITGVLIPVQR